MNTLKEKVAYLQGLAEGLKLDDSSKEGKILLGVLELLSDMSQTVSDLEENVEELEDYVDCIDDDLAALEEDADDDFVEIVCPHCGETVYFDPDCLDDEDEPLCPSCGKALLEEDEDAQ